MTEDFSPLHQCRQLLYFGEMEAKAMAGENKKSEYRNAWIAEKLGCIVFVGIVILLTSV